MYVLPVNEVEKMLRKLAIWSDAAMLKVCQRRKYLSSLGGGKVRVCTFRCLPAAVGARASKKFPAARLPRTNVEMSQLCN